MVLNLAYLLKDLSSNDITYSNSITETTVSVAVAKDMRAKCLEFCPEACPADLFQRMESNCKPSCRKATGVDFYDDACEACVHKYVGKSCYACFGQCFRDMQYHDPKP